MVRTRFAPSPTGYLHIGSLRTAAYAYAQAKSQSGQFILRIEDTDQKREVPHAVEKIKTILQQFKLNWDEFYVQSERVKTRIYHDAALQLVSQGQAFYCQCDARNAKQDGFSKHVKDPCRDKGLTSGAIKLKVPSNTQISYHDYILNEDISWHSDDIPDATLLKSDLFPTYHLAMPVDDHAMGITHVIRAVEWLPSTPIHLLVFNYLGYNIPHLGHPTTILDPAGGKLSKRKGNVSVEDFLSQGYLPQAILNFVILLGWAPKDNRELFTLAEFVSAFDPAGFQKSNPKLNLEKLNWFNGQYLRNTTNEELVLLVKPFFPEAGDSLLRQIIPLAKERVTTLTDFSHLCKFFITPPSPQALNAEHLAVANAVLTVADWTKSGIEEPLLSNIKARNWKVGDFFMTLRLAITGSKITPPLTESMLILGKLEVLRRIHAALPMDNVK